MDGIFNLRCAHDLLGKLEQDFARLRDNPRDETAAIDFFVTAESLLDWLHPGHLNRQARESERSANIVMQVTSHLATGAKHFRPEAKHHKSVKHSKKVGGTFAARTFAAGMFKANTFSKGNLIIELEGEAERQLGESISAILLAQLVLDHWKQRISNSHPGDAN